MEFDAKTLKEKLNCYFKGEITQGDLGEWANKAYYDILKGGYIETKKIVIYPFLKTISTFHVEENDKEDVFPCSEEEVKKVGDILNGIIDFEFDVEISVPFQVYNMFKEKQYYDAKRREIFVKLRSEIIQCFERSCKISNEMAIQLKKIIHIDSQNRTIQDMLENHIFLLVKNLFKDNFIDTCDEEQFDFKLFAQKSNGDLIFKRLIDYLDSYIGNRNFYLFISYKRGIPDIFLLV